MFGVGCLVLPEHEGDGGEEGDDSTKGDVAPRSRWQSWTVQQDVQTIQQVCYLRYIMSKRGAQDGNGGSKGETSRGGGGEEGELVIW